VSGILDWRGGMVEESMHNPWAGRALGFRTATIGGMMPAVNLTNQTVSAEALFLF
jgi:hypothetical protein